MEVLKTIEEIFSIRLRSLRGELTQAQMAESLEIEQGTYQRWESGRFIPQAAQRAWLAEKTGHPEAWFFLDSELGPDANLLNRLELYRIISQLNEAQVRRLLQDARIFLQPGTAINNDIVRTDSIKKGKSVG
jgi:transcriptional regulator with XRE-family HTH domain